MQIYGTKVSNSFLYEISINIIIYFALDQHFRYKDKCNMNRLRISYSRSRISVHNSCKSSLLLLWFCGISLSTDILPQSSQQTHKPSLKISFICMYTLSYPLHIISNVKLKKVIFQTCFHLISEFLNTSVTNSERESQANNPSCIAPPTAP